jgi:hypothetical protein
MVAKQVMQSGVIDEAQIQAFQAELRGQLIRPDDAIYDEARAVYNGMIDKRPAYIVRCANVADCHSIRQFRVREWAYRRHTRRRAQRTGIGHL